MVNITNIRKIQINTLEIILYIHEDVYLKRAKGTKYW